MTIPTEFFTDFLNVVSQISSDILPLFLMAFGFPLGFWFISKFLAVVRRSVNSPL
jgi:hypothetical protein